ncbi:hypothetical protein SARC_11027 [Sphaeroforma arctica JP610]|uniref:Uncharacterized protein n=1 Tax=Sphaeroforma arctica JP610 TaxID=667725 RepID=A0A0L0FI93_9EUKA|nr:hypothetical protein SARC_11027 [Sphaeroforma arctica JP610]KNC76475.1 hypothetical protein SARC_11027 [Sphaeroforma arctica JP610]|eukprot:XP_014150377.1 hypothetical protein SARC_11027 [Sphaeroforma arctica JP610]
MKSDGYCGMAQNLDSAKLLAAKYMSMYRTFPTDHVFSRNESLPADHVFGNGATDTKSGAYMARYADTYYITWHRPKLGGCWAGRVYAWPISRVREAGREDPLSWIPEKHVTSMIVFNAQREFDAQLGLDITPGRLSYDMEMDPLVPVDYLPSRREN